MLGFVCLFLSSHSLLLFLFVFLICCRNEYLIFQKIIKLEYEFPEKFFPKAKDLVEQLLVSCPLFLLLFLFHVCEKMH